MLSKNQLKYKMCKYCEEGRLPEVEGYSEAIASPEKYVLHHRMEIQPDGTRLSKQWMIDHGIYFNLHPCMLVFMPAKEHNAMHCALTHKGSKHNQEHINRGAMTSLKTPGQEFFAHYGKLPCEDRKLYAKLRQRKRFNNPLPWEVE